MGEEDGCILRRKVKQKQREESAWTVAAKEEGSRSSSGWGHKARILFPSLWGPLLG